MADCRGEQKTDPEAALEFLAKRCQWAVVTLGSNGCIAKHGKEVSPIYSSDDTVLLLNMTNKMKEFTLSLYRHRLLDLSPQLLSLSTFSWEHRTKLAKANK